MQAHDDQKQEEACCPYSHLEGLRILSTRTLDVYIFFNKQANLTKLDDFFQSLSGNNLV